MIRTFFSKKNKDEVRYGQLVIQNASKVSKYLAPDEIRDIAETFLSAHGQRSIKDELTIKFCSKDKTTAKLRSRIAIFWALVWSILLLPLFLEPSFATLVLWIAGLVFLISLCGRFYRQTAAIFDPKTLSVIVFVNKALIRENLIRYIIHELDHFVWFVEHDGYFDNSLPYHKRLHEKRAYERTDIWMSTLALQKRTS